MDNFSPKTIISKIFENIHDAEDVYMNISRLFIHINSGLISDDALEKENIIESLLTAITIHSTNEQVVYMGMLIIVILTINSDKAREIFSGIKGEETILSILKQCPKSKEYGFVIPNLFGNVMCPSDGYRYSSPYLRRVILAMIDYANTFIKDDKMITNTIIMLANVGCNSRKSQILIRKCGGIESIIKWMWHYKDNPTIQQKGCFALGNLAGDSSENRIEIGSKGGISAIINAMRAFPDKSSVQNYAAYAIGNSCCNCSFNSTLFREMGGLEIAVDAFRRFIDDTRFLSYSPNSLGNLAGDLVENKIRMCELGLIDLVIEAMILHFGVMDICRSCSRVIEFLLANEETYSKYMNYKIGSTIENAFKRHPDCKGLENALNAIKRQVHPLIKEAIEEGVCTRKKVFCKDQCPSNKYNYYCPKCCVPQYTYNCMTCYEKYSQCVRLCETCYKSHPKDHVCIKVFMSRRCANEPIFTEDLVNVRSLCADNGYDVDIDDDDDDDDDEFDDDDIVDDDDDDDFDDDEFGDEFIF